MPKHVSRLLVLLGAGLAAALAAKWFFTAKSFYEFGHYRGDSVVEIAAQEPVFRTSAYCQACHSERHAQWSAASHKSVACETCHGPAVDHPQRGKLPVPADTRKLCSLCHERMPGRPRTQPQVVLAQHGASQQCATCHNPHAPKLAGVVPAVKGDLAAGRKKHTETCSACHGANGISPNETWPNLAGQKAAYLVRILGAYKSGAQSDVMMSPVAQGLSEREIQDLATYYSSLSCTADSSAQAPGDAAAGKLLAKNCAACHGETGSGANPAWPDIAAQKAVYLANTLKAFRAGLRKDPMMASVVRGLSDADIANLAAYYATQSCRRKP